MQITHILMAIAVAAGWGFNFVAAKMALMEIPPFLLLFFRFMLVSALLIPFVPVPKIPWKHLALQSLMLGTLHFSLMFAAIAMGLNASGAVIATQLGVPFSCLLSALVYKDYPGKWRSLGMVVAFLGVIVIAGTPSVMSQFDAFLVCCVAAVAWAGSNIAMKRVGEVHILSFLAYMSLLCVPQMAILSFVFEQDQLQILQEAHWKSWVSLLYTVFFSTIMAYGCWYWLLTHLPISKVSPFSMLVPVFGIGASQLFFHEPLTMQFFVGGAMILAGVGIILLRIPKFGMLEK